MELDRRRAGHNLQLLTCAGLAARTASVQERTALRGETPCGQTGLLLPQRLYYVDRSSATLDGVRLGHPTRLRRNPTIGNVPLPARGILAIGQASWVIRDPEEFHRTRSELTQKATTA